MIELRKLKYSPLAFQSTNRGKPRRFIKSGGGINGSGHSGPLVSGTVVFRHFLEVTRFYTDRTTQMPAVVVVKEELPEATLFGMGRNHSRPMTEPASENPDKPQRRAALGRR